MRFAKILCSSSELSLTIDVFVFCILCHSRDIAEFALGKHGQRIEEAANALFANLAQMQREMELTPSYVADKHRTKSLHSNAAEAAAPAGQKADNAVECEWVHVATVRMPDFKSWVSVLNIDDLAAVCGAGYPLSAETAERVLSVSQ